MTASAITLPAEGPANVQWVVPRGKEPAPGTSLEESAHAAASTLPVGAAAIAREALVSLLPAPVSSPERDAAASLVGDEIEPVQADAQPPAGSTCQLAEGTAPAESAADPATAAVDSLDMLLLAACAERQAHHEGADSKEQERFGAENLADEDARPSVSSRTESASREQVAGKDRGEGAVGQSAPGVVDTSSAEPAHGDASTPVASSWPWCRREVRLHVKRHCLKWTRSGRRWMRRR